MNSRQVPLGAFGVDTITTTAAASPPPGNAWCAIQGAYGPSATVFAVLSETNSVVSGTIASALLGAGELWFGHFTGLTLTSGAVRCYRVRTSG